MSNDWPKRPVQWIEDRRLFISIPFTWNLPEVYRRLWQRSIEWDRAIVGGPAVQLMPDFFDDIPDVETGDHYPDVLSKINPYATRTTVGCPRNCKFCAVDRLEPVYKELDDWPDRPEIVDNNILGASLKHFDKVVDRLLKHSYPFFNGGLDARLLTKYHAERIAELPNPNLYLALDNMRQCDAWSDAFEYLRNAGIPKRGIRSFVIVGFDSDPADAWDRCNFIEAYGVKPCPVWFHALDALERNIVTEDQKRLGWTDFERRKIMQWFYKHRKAVEHSGTIVGAYED